MSKHGYGRVLKHQPAVSAHSIVRIKQRGQRRAKPDFHPSYGLLRALPGHRDSPRADFPVAAFYTLYRVKGAVHFEMLKSLTLTLWLAFSVRSTLAGQVRQDPLKDDRSGRLLTFGHHVEPDFEASFARHESQGLPVSVGHSHPEHQTLM